MVMGDNRGNSRVKSVGFIEKEYLMGKAVFRFCPFF
jgi:hypothetical protein